MPSFLETLMMLNRGELPPIPKPAPSMPLPVSGPASTIMPPGPMPEMAPPAPLPALDTNLINQYSGPTPVAPTLQQPSFLDKLSTTLLGVSAGLQGRAPQYIESVREERQRPIREYEAALERFNTRRLAGVEAATQKQQREQERIQRRADANAEFEREQFLQRSKFRSEEARALAAQAFDLEKEREKERRQDERDAARERAAEKKRRDDIATKLQLDKFASSSIANEIADSIVYRKPLSAAAEKWRSVQERKLEAQLAAVRGGGSGSGQVMAQLANGQTVPASLVNRETGGVMLNGQVVPVVQYVGGNIPRAPQGPQPLPGEVGGPEGPFVPQAATQALPGGITMTTPAVKMSRGAAKAKLVKGGFSSKEADAELDRLGIR